MFVSVLVFVKINKIYLFTVHFSVKLGNEDTRITRTIKYKQMLKVINKQRSAFFKYTIQYYNFLVITFRRWLCSYLYCTPFVLPIGPSWHWFEHLQICWLKRTLKLTMNIMIFLSENVLTRNHKGLVTRGMRGKESQFYLVLICRYMDIMIRTTTNFLKKSCSIFDSSFKWDKV